MSHRAPAKSGKPDMQKFTQLTGVAAPLPEINIDTDKIFPAVYLKTIKRTGLAQWLFQEIRFRPDGSENLDFVLNQGPYRQAKIIVAGDNFGCGSSREHAPWALMDFGISCVIAPSFADIFYNNCFKNGLLPIALPQDVVDQLMEDAKKGANAVMTIDLEAQTISRPDGEKVHFDIDPFRKHCLLNGLDDIGLTEQKADAIADYERRTRQERPWVFGMTQAGT
jgi:3-isopropylmalate/(R)-2-methylmalate dehydratase small subunit